LQRVSARIGENGSVTTEQPTSDAANQAAATHTRIRTLLLTAVIALGADLVSKVLIVANVPPEHRPIRVLGGLLYIEQARNSGAAFSVGTGATVILTAISVVVVIVIVRAARRMTSPAWAVSLGLVLGGALGNLTDRFFRAPGVGKGHVVDWISVFGPDGQRWPIFNLADSAIVVGGAVAVLLSLRGVDFNGTRNPMESDVDADEPVAGKPADDGGTGTAPSSDG
jgi:signal peptidase II